HRAGGAGDHRRRPRPPGAGCAPRRAAARRRAVTGTGRGPPRPRAHPHDAQPLPGEPASRPAGRRRAREPTAPPTDRPIGAARPVTTPSPDSRDLDWLITSFAPRIPGVTSVVVLSTDGMALAASQDLPRERAETLAAVSSGLASLSTGASHHLQTGAVNQVIVEMEGGFLFITAISEGSALAVVSGPRSEEHTSELQSRESLVCRLLPVKQ